MPINFETRPWWTYIFEDLRELMKQSELLLRIFEKDAHNGEKFHDYSFIVFPAAKAYEGYLKTIFRDLGFISQEDFDGKRFRIGRALNPALDRQFREGESVYDKLENYCKDRDLADALWDTWKEARNLLFHWFPNEKNAVNYDQAKELVERIVDTMDLAFKECNINK